MTGPPHSHLALWLSLLVAGVQPTLADDNDWHYGGYADLSYVNDLGGNREIDWRNKLTTRNLNAVDPNMGMVYLSKVPSATSPWGMELGAQAGLDVDAQMPTERNETIPGADIIKNISRANISYRAPLGNGLKLTAGLMNSFIGFESMYARLNPNYTRAWIADYSPYFLIGAGGEYAFSETLSTGFYLLSDYDYLSFNGQQPKYGGQVVWHFSPDWSLTQNIYFGPEQNHSQIDYWRGFSDTQIKWSNDVLMITLGFDAGTEKRATTGLQTLWMGSALWTHWQINGPWSLAFRPELYWDPDGELTGSRQFIYAFTTTAEYLLEAGPASVALRTEFRHDTSTGKDGGFFNPTQTGPSLVSGQNLFFISLLWAYDSTHTQ